MEQLVACRTSRPLRQRGHVVTLTVWVTAAMARNSSESAEDGAEPVALSGIRAEFRLALQQEIEAARSR